MSGASIHVAMSLIGADYVFERQLGSGGNGVVVLARQRSVDRLVAVKTISTGAAAGPAHARLRREGRTLAALGHPNVLEVYRLIEDRDAIALVTEYVPGGDLADAMRHNTLRGSQFIDTLCQTASALSAAHSVGIVHRDVKPANVLLDGTDRAVVADFGLARLRGEYRTEDGLVTGTPRYMSPEQIDAPGDERPSMDVYSFAVMTYQILCRRPPFVADRLAELVHAQRHSAPPPPHTVRPELPLSVSDVLVQALAKEPAHRASLDDITRGLRMVEPDQWDQLLPAASTNATQPGPARTSAADTGAPATEQDELMGTAQPAPSRVDDGPITKRAPIESASIEPTLYELHASDPPHRRRLRIVAVVVGLLVGILLGLGILEFL